MRIVCENCGSKRLLVLHVGRRPSFFGSARWGRQYNALLALDNILKETDFYDGSTFRQEGSEVRLRVDPQRI